MYMCMYVQYIGLSLLCTIVLSNSCSGLSISAVGLTVGVILGFILALIIIVVIICVVFCRKRRKTHKESISQPPREMNQVQTVKEQRDVFELCTERNIAYEHNIIHPQSYGKSRVDHIGSERKTCQSSYSSPTEAQQVGLSYGEYVTFEPESDLEVNRTYMELNPDPATTWNVAYDYIQPQPGQVDHSEGEAGRSPYQPRTEMGQVGLTYGKYEEYQPESDTIGNV